MSIENKPISRGAPLQKPDKLNLDQLLQPFRNEKWGTQAWSNAVEKMMSSLPPAEEVGRIFAREKDKIKEIVFILAEESQYDEDLQLKVEQYMVPLLSKFSSTEQKELMKHLIAKKISGAIIASYLRCLSIEVAEEFIEFNNDVLKAFGQKIEDLFKMRSQTIQKYFSLILKDYQYHSAHKADIETMIEQLAKLPTVPYDHINLWFDIPVSKETEEKLFEMVGKLPLVSFEKACHDLLQLDTDKRKRAVTFLLKHRPQDVFRLKQKELSLFCSLAAKGPVKDFEEALSKVNGKLLTFEGIMPLFSCAYSPAGIEQFARIIKESDDLALKAISKGFEANKQKQMEGGGLTALRDAFFQEWSKGKESVSYRECTDLFPFPLSEEEAAVLLTKSRASKDEKMQKSIERFLLLKEKWTQLLETEQLSSFEIFKIALFIEHEIAPTEKVAEKVFKRKDTGLKRTLQVSESGVSVFANKKISRLRAKGGQKRITSAATMALRNCTGIRKTVRAVTFTRGETYSLAREMRLVKEYQSKFAGFVSSLGVSEYTFSLKGQELPRVSAILEFCDGDLEGLFLKQDVERSEHREVLQKTPLTQVARSFLQPLALMHTEGEAHGDVKLENMMYVFDRAKGTLDVRVGDLGVSNAITELNNRQSAWYPTPVYSAPEFIANAAGGDGRVDFEKADSFASGIMLYKMLLKREVPWYDDLVVLYKDKEKLEETAKQHQSVEAVSQKVKALTESPRAKELAAQQARGEKLSPNDLVEHIMYQMMQCDPIKRMTCKQAAALLQ